MKFFKSEKGEVNYFVLAIALLICVVAAYFISPMITAYEDARESSVSQVDTFTSQATGVGVTTKDVTITQSVLDDLTSNMAVTSSIAESPTADSLSGSTLTVGSLTDNTTRTLTVTYDHDLISDFTALDTIIAISPTLIILGLVVTVAIVGFLGVRKLQGL